VPPSERLVIGLCGIPASGKSSLAQAVVKRVNQISGNGNGSDGDEHGDGEIAIYIGLDGWHLSRATLAAFPDPQDAFARRGAHWTFSATGYLDFVSKLRAPITELPIHAPSFSHVLKDPVENDLEVTSSHRIVLIEGLYVFLHVEPWSAAGHLLDERWFLEVDVEVARERLVQRHIKTGVTNHLEDAVLRARDNDMPSTSSQFQCDSYSTKSSSRWRVCPCQHDGANITHTKSG
jgi:pantothenate kinase